MGRRSNTKSDEKSDDNSAATSVKILKRAPNGEHSQETLPAVEGDDSNKENNIVISPKRQKTALVPEVQQEEVVMILSDEPEQTSMDHDHWWQDYCSEVMNLRKDVAESNEKLQSLIEMKQTDGIPDFITEVADLAGKVDEGMTALSDHKAIVETAMNLNSTLLAKYDQLAQNFSTLAKAQQKWVEEQDHAKKFNSIIELISPLHEKINTIGTFVSGVVAASQRPLTDGKERDPSRIPLKKKYCVFCDKLTHTSEECKTVTGYDDRRAMAKQKNICVKCIGQYKEEGQGHVNCPQQNIVCPRCSAKVENKAMSAHSETFCFLKKEQNTAKDRPNAPPRNGLYQVKHAKDSSHENEMFQKRSWDPKQYASTSDKRH
ncbi:hypothetical protein CRE_07098 [Caenorhabditis remanei]|uniref:Uncharacterized protein n=1 Tax=Caenorhabditis remanei TaxID=31234 RepID=E3NM51_CAERE|nr:hypothetical protein CRE_07098 [Caenorhabditis remanei]